MLPSFHVLALAFMQQTAFSSLKPLYFYVFLVNIPTPLKKAALWRVIVCFLMYKFLYCQNVWLGKHRQYIHRVFSSSLRSNTFISVAMRGPISQNRQVSSLLRVCNICMNAVVF